MAFDEATADRIRQVLSPLPDVGEIAMMGGLVFTLRGHMCCGVKNDALMVRVGPHGYDAALAEPFVEPLDIGGGRRPRAFVIVNRDGFAKDEALTRWISRGLAFVATLAPKAAKG